MAVDFLIQKHPWLFLREALQPSFPTEKQVIAMKKVMDGEKDAKRQDLKDGMATAGIKNLYELVLWGLQTGVIKDKPIQVSPNMFNQPNFVEGFPTWYRVLYAMAMDGSDKKVMDQAGISKESLEFYKKWITEKFKLKDSQASLIRFAFQATNPISGPKSAHTPHKAKRSPHQTIKYPPMYAGGFKPAEIDPNIPIHTATLKNRDLEKSIPRLRGTVTKNVVPKIVRVTAITKALEILGIDPVVIYAGDKGSKMRGRGPFWERSASYLWNMLELSRTRYEYEISHAHPDRGGNPKRAAQLNAAWDLIKKMFAKHGYVHAGKHVHFKKE